MSFFTNFRVEPGQIDLGNPARLFSYSAHSYCPGSTRFESKKNVLGVCKRCQSGPFDVGLQFWESFWLEKKADWAGSTWFSRIKRVEPAHPILYGGKIGLIRLIPFFSTRFWHASEFSRVCFQEVRIAAWNYLRVTMRVERHKNSETCWSQPVLVVKAEGEDLDTPGDLRGDRVRRDVGDLGSWVCPPWFVRDETLGP